MAILCAKNYWPDLRELPPSPRSLCHARRWFVCLSVCLLATLPKTTERIFMKIFTTDLSVDKEDIVNVWLKSSASESWRSEKWKISTSLHCLIAIANGLQLLTADNVTVHLTINKYPLCISTLHLQQFGLDEGLHSASAVVWKFNTSVHSLVAF